MTSLPWRRREPGWAKMLLEDSWLTPLLTGAAPPN